METQTKKNRLVTSVEIQKEVGISKKTFIKWKSLGLIEPVIKIGNVMRYDLEVTMQKLRKGLNA